MGEPASLFAVSSFLLIALPFSSCLLLGLCVAVGSPPSERIVERGVAAVMLTSFLLCVGLAWTWLRQDEPALVVHLGNWYAWGSHRVGVDLRWDRLSTPFALLSVFLIGLTGFFSSKYLHRDPGFHRFFLLYLFFVAGIELLFLANTWDLLVMGWEAVGISSVLLIAFFQFRTSPVRHALVALVTYRLCDVALFTAALVWHHWTKSSELTVGPPSAITQAWCLSVLCWIAVVGKSAQLPASAWLPKAMEGPTPSSAIFYGALAVHAGPYLLLRVAPLWQSVPGFGCVIAVTGLSTAVFAAFVGHVRSDVKTLLAYATMAQLGLIFGEIGLGFHTLALCHSVGHSLIRTLQLLRAPSVLGDFQELDMERAYHPSGLLRLLHLWPQRARTPTETWLYRQALAGANLEAAMRAIFISPFLACAAFVERLENVWLAVIDGKILSADTRGVIPGRTAVAAGDSDQRGES